MAEINIQVSEKEMLCVIKAITELNNIAHIRNMSQSMIANTAAIKATKVRAVLIELISKKYITQYQVSENPRLQRYYYVVEEAGKLFVSAMEKSSAK